MGQAVPSKAPRNSHHMSNGSPTKRKRNYKTGVSLEPEIVSYLDELSSQTGLNRSWILNTIVSQHAQLARRSGVVPPLSREAIIRI